MFSHGRACLKRRGVSTVSDNIAAAHDEPLLFLYPHWFKSAVRHSRPLSSGSAAFLRNHRPRRLIPRASHPPQKLYFGPPSRRLISGSNSAAPIETETTKKAFTAQDEAPTSDTITGSPDNGSPNPTKNLDGILLTDSEPTKQPNLSSFPMSNLLKSIVQSPDMDEWPRRRRRKLKAIPRFGPKDSMKLELLANRTRLLPASKRAPIPLKTIQGWVVQLHQKSLAWATASNTKQKEVLVTEETLAYLAGCTTPSSEENIWYAPVRHGCRVHVQHSSESEGKYRKIILSGTDRVIEVVCDHINHARTLQENKDPEIEIAKPPVPVFPSLQVFKHNDTSRPLIRGVWGDHGTSELEPLKSAAENLSTVRGFAEFVEDLTSTMPRTDIVPRPKPANAFPESISRVHNNQVAFILMKIFSRSAYEKLFSTAAMNIALTWLCRHEYFGKANKILSRCEHVATVDTFNILLESAAEQQNTEPFRHYLKTMSRMKIGPNEETWVAFLNYVADPRERLLLMKWMLQQRYLTEITPKARALVTTVQEWFLEHLEDGGKVDSFFTEMAKMQGTHNVSLSLFSQMFNVVARRDDFDSLNRLLEIYQQHGFHVDDRAIESVMLMCRDSFTGVRHLLRLSSRPDLSLKRVSYERLFKKSLRGRHYNLCRVLWRYACMYGFVTYQMRRYVVRSLTCNIPSENAKSEVDQTWWTTSGQVIAGLDLHHREHIRGSKIMQSIPPEHHHHPVTYFSEFKPVGKERDRQLRAAMDLAQHDIDAGPKYTPRYPLAHMLQAAIVLDRYWAQYPLPKDSILEQAMRIEVLRKGEDLNKSKSVYREVSKRYPEKDPEDKSQGISEEDPNNNPEETPQEDSRISLEDPQDDFEEVSNSDSDEKPREDLKEEFKEVSKEEPQEDPEISRKEPEDISEEVSNYDSKEKPQDPNEEFKEEPKYPAV
ncbi:hypothetical protein P170DRAFT_434764 [Aspergillus steynii IBT 23096]|uniref:Pentatricopeptide repeat protein n=1 Tax=Aspergillus steynii IBT 23096 TaxID=1392250 RepID=A0A2I2GJI1_9EURO|nr:uncharacterized protein P170DRAFT_434764 [Aspergillus steynii IBT 23096]PLB53041.1 hypothetical protein P170DRAFT_434764 [Aspergillus steynii IBT 23096]